MGGYPNEQPSSANASAPDRGNGPGQSQSYGIEDGLNWLGSAIESAAETTYHAGAQVYNAGAQAVDHLQEDYHRTKHVLAAFELADSYVSPILEKRLGMEVEELKKTFMDGLEKILLFLALATVAGAAGGAAVGALAGGAGALPGAVVGGELGLDAGIAILEYLGLAILIAQIGLALPDILGKVQHGTKVAWNAGIAQPTSLQSDIHNAAIQLAEAEAELMIVILDAVLAWILKDSAALRSEKLLQELRTLKAGMKDAELLAARSKEILDALRNKPAEMEAAINKAIDEFTAKLRKAGRLTKGLIDFVRKNLKKMLGNSADKAEKTVVKPVELRGGTSEGGGGAAVVKPKPSGSSDRDWSYQPKQLERDTPGAVPKTGILRVQMEEAGARTAPAAPGGFPQMSDSIARTFNADPIPETLPAGTKLYRIIGDDDSASGSYWSLDPPPATEAEWRGSNAVLDPWNGDGGYVSSTVPDEGLNVWSGPTAPQALAPDGTSVLPGGATQIWVPRGTITPDGPPMPTPWNH